jgi:hypothetical protein
MRWRKSMKPARPTQTCLNEGCGRPAEGPICETCELEWGLYHREAREARRTRPSEASFSPPR